VIENYLDKKGISEDKIHENKNKFRQIERKE
jgi:hypothetical protein